MKLHHINKVLGVGLAALLLSACTDKNDWNVDSSKARLFSVSNTDISVDRDLVTADVTFKVVKGVSSYVMEISSDELNDGIAQGATPHSKIYTFSSKEAVDSKITTQITGLSNDTRYWLRIRSLGDGVNPSKWSYYSKNNKNYFKTKAEQIFKTYTYFASKTIQPKNLKEDEVILTWNETDFQGQPVVVTHLLLTVADKAPQTITLDDEANTNHRYTIKYADYGIAPGADFNIKIFNNTDKRGEFDLSAPEARPAGLVEVADGTEIKNAIESGSGDIVLGIPASQVDDASDKFTIAGITIPASVTSVTFYGLAGGIPRLLDFTKQIAVAADVTHLTKIRFENLQVQTSAKFGGLIYLTSTTNALTVDAIEFENVTIPQLKESSLIQLNNAKGVTVNKFSVELMDFKQQTDTGTRFIYANNNNNNVFESIEISNSTFAQIKHTMFDNNGKGTFKNITLTDVTLYNCIGKGRYFVSAKGTEPHPTIQAFRTIFAKSYGADCRGIQSTSSDAKADYTFSSSYMTNDFKIEEKDNGDGTKSLQFPFYVGNEVGASTKIMKDPKNGNYTITDSNVEGGDPRWIEPEDE